MKKALILVLFVVSAGLFGWEMNRYATSGTEITSIPLSANTGTIDNLILTPEMSKTRLILSISYEVNLQEGLNRLYTYQVALRDQGGQLVAEEDRTHEKSLGDQGSAYEANSQNHIISSFDVPVTGSYQVSWDLNPKKASIKEATLKVRRNVSDLNIPILVISGILFALGWVLIFISRRSNIKEV
ncbi:hypothetical protein [Sneathiella limimaris]|uniref:hypothetical protein n=1 Tax=Sneathiella limimaris TaxID=1964213 RepID=UPI00146D1067|nr:hypothetical protein [Sneathiella limimaris]